MQRGCNGRTLLKARRDLLAPHAVHYKGASDRYLADRDHRRHEGAFRLVFDEHSIRSIIERTDDNADIPDDERFRDVVREQVVSPARLRAGEGGRLDLGALVAGSDGAGAQPPIIN